MPLIDCSEESSEEGSVHPSSKSSEKGSVDQVSACAGPSGPLLGSSSASSASSDNRSEKDSDCSDPTDEVSVGSNDSADVREVKNDGRLKSLKNKVKTFKARAAALVGKARRRLARNAVVKPPEHRAEAFRDDVKHDSSLHRPGSNSTYDRNRRLRLLISFLKMWASRLMSFVNHANADSKRRIHHTISSTIVDDTNMRLSTVAPDVSAWKSSRVTPVMNAVQTFTLCYTDENPAEPAIGADRCQHKTYTVHTPMAALARSDQNTLFCELTSRLVLFLGAVSERFERIGVAASFAKDIPIQVSTLCFDSLITNIAMLKQIRSRVHQKHSMDGHRQIFPFFTVKCVIHQLALSRRCLLFGFDKFWSMLVRLAHLMEVSSFRTQFRRAVLAVACQSFSYIPVAELPRACQDWKHRRNELTGVLSGSSKKRLEIHQELSRWDNGNPDSDSIPHYCLGHCCQGGSHDSKSRFAMVQIAKRFSLLFSFGYPVPLAYRWVHAARALQFVRELWHNIMTCFSSLGVFWSLDKYGN